MRTIIRGEHDNLRPVKIGIIVIVSLVASSVFLHFFRPILPVLLGFILTGKIEVEPTVQLHSWFVGNRSVEVVLEPDQTGIEIVQIGFKTPSGIVAVTPEASNVLCMFNLWSTRTWRTVPPFCKLQLLVPYPSGVNTTTLVVIARILGKRVVLTTNITPPPTG